MTLAQNQLKRITQLKTELAYSKVEHLLSQYYEDQLAKEVSQLFRRMKKQILFNLEEYYDPDVMFQAHLDLILAPIHELHKEYYELLVKYKIREFDKGRASGKRIVARMVNYQRKGKILKPLNVTLKADLSEALTSEINKDKLFGTSPVSHDNLRERTYMLSERTLNRVDGDINNIITKGYDDGWGINKVGKDITDRFGQLESWEAKRIARTEIHNSQLLGIIKGYDDLGVEYIEWASARDNRVRGLKPSDRADHVHMDGEIIPLGGTFSNGLQYPGDMNGSAAEIINCRCSAIPFIMPDGYIAPSGMAQFHESDLVATLDYFNADDIVAQAMQEIDIPTETILPTGMKPINADVLTNFDIKPIPDIGKKRHPIKLTREVVNQYPKEFLKHKWYDFQDSSSKIAKHYESYYTEKFMEAMKQQIPGNTLTGTKSIYDSFKYGCGNNFGRLNAYYRDKAKYLRELKQLGETDDEIRIIAERYDKIEENLLEGMKQAVPLTEDTFTYRATSTNHKIPTKVGERGVFKGFTSTSFDKETPAIYYQRDSKKYNVFYNILNPKGTRGMALESTDKFTNTNGQAELLLPETEYEIVHVVQNGNNYEITVKLINQII